MWGEEEFLAGAVGISTIHSFKPFETVQNILVICSMCTGMIVIPNLDIQIEAICSLSTLTIFFHHPNRNRAHIVHDKYKIHSHIRYKSTNFGLLVDRVAMHMPNKYCIVLVCVYVCMDVCFHVSPHATITMHEFPIFEHLSIRRFRIYCYRSETMCYSFSKYKDD